MGYFTDRGIRRATRKTARYTKKDYRRAVKQDRYVRDVMNEPIREAERARLQELREAEVARHQQLGSVGATRPGQPVMQPRPPAPPPGWYPDPTDALSVTWWDGVRWIPESRRRR